MVGQIHRPRAAHPPPEEFEKMLTIIAAVMVPMVWQGSGFKPKEMPELAGVNGVLLAQDNVFFYRWYACLLAPGSIVPLTN